MSEYSAHVYWSAVVLGLISQSAVSLFPPVRGAIVLYRGTNSTFFPLSRYRLIMFWWVPTATWARLLVQCWCRWGTSGVGIPAAEEVAGPEWLVRTCVSDVGVGSSAVGASTGGGSTAA